MIIRQYCAEGFLCVRAGTLTCFGLLWTADSAFNIFHFVCGVLVFSLQ